MADKIKGITIQLGADTSKYSKGMKDAEKSADSLGTKLKSAAATAAKALAAAGAAAAAAAVAIGKSAVDAYADYEQLSGGVETMFKGSSDTVMEYAENAYKTAGISANDYMEQVTSFSASLIQSLDGDTAAAAEVADTAIKDMSDNANKFGTDIESIQNAYQGFAKENYTMLDNLKLGYGGTKSEMERLIEDANKIAVAQGEAGDLTIDSYADVIEAIHLVQDEMGITGTTAEEAEGTISGSIATTKAAWDNLLVSLGTGENVEENLTAVMDSAANVLSNLTPVVERIIENIPTVISTLAEQGEKIASEIWQKIKDKFIELFPESEGVFSEFETKVQEWMDKIQGIIDTVWALIQDIWTNYGDEIKAVVETVFGAISTTIDTTLTVIQDIIDVFSALVSGDWETTWNAIKKLADDVWEGIKTIINNAINIVMSVIDGLFAFITPLWESGFAKIETTARNITDSIKKTISTWIEGIKTKISTTLTAIKTTITTITNTIKTTISTWVDGIKTKLSDTWKSIKNTVSETWNGIKDIIKGIVDKAKDWGKDLIKNFVDGLKQKWEDLKGTISDIADGIKDFLGFSEPKKGPLSDFHTYAPDMMQLYAKGIKDNAYLVTDQLNALASGMSVSARSTTNLSLTTPVYLDGKVIASVVNQKLGVLL